MKTKNASFNYNKFIEITKKLYSVYDDGYQFPTFIFTIPEKKLIQYMKTTIVYYEKEKDKILAYTREPVNIAMNRYYDLSLMKEYFGYDVSKYNEKSSNIAIFTKTFISFNKNNKNINLDINVLNVIGVALDSRKQYDYIRLYRIKDIFDRCNEYENMVKSFFTKIKKCFIDHKFELLYLSAIGLGNFSRLCSHLNINPYIIFNKILNETFDDTSNIVLWCFSRYSRKFIKTKENNICNLSLEDLLSQYNNIIYKCL
jgi:hypothetical protein